LSATLKAQKEKIAGRLECGQRQMNNELKFPRVAATLVGAALQSLFIALTFTPSALAISSVIKPPFSE
jgi:hypothetical protein